MNEEKAIQIINNLIQDGILSSEEQDAFRFFLDRIESFEKRFSEHVLNQELPINDCTMKFLELEITPSLQESKPCHDTCKYLRVEHDAWGSRFYVCTKHYKQLAESTLAYNYCDSYEKKDEK